MSAGWRRRRPHPPPEHGRPRDARAGRLRGGDRSHSRPVPGVTDRVDDRIVDRRGQCPAPRVDQCWTVLPEFCSVNFAEPGTEELCDLLLSKGIAVEAGLSSIADARVFVDSPFRERCLRVLIEIEPGGPEDPVKSAAAISRILDAGGIRSPRLQHGLGACAWPILRDAIARGYDLRIGLEDTLTLRDNSRAAGNADLVASVARLVSQIPAPR